MRFHYIEAIVFDGLSGALASYYGNSGLAGQARNMAKAFFTELTKVPSYRFEEYSGHIVDDSADLKPVARAMADALMASNLLQISPHQRPELEEKILSYIQSISKK